MPPFRPSDQQYHHYCWPREVGTRDNPPSSPGMRKVTERFDGERMAWTYEWKVFYEVVMVSHDLWLFLQATEVIRIEKKKKKKTKECYTEYGWIRTTFTFSVGQSASAINIRLLWACAEILVSFACSPKLYVTHNLIWRVSIDLKVHEEKASKRISKNKVHAK